jgi:hypothetical protein
MQSSVVGVEAGDALRAVDFAKGVVTGVVQLEMDLDISCLKLSASSRLTGGGIIEKVVREKDLTPGIKGSVLGSCTTPGMRGLTGVVGDVGKPKRARVISAPLASPFRGGGIGTCRIEGVDLADVESLEFAGVEGVELKGVKRPPMANRFE